MSDIDTVLQDMSDAHNKWRERLVDDCNASLVHMMSVISNCRKLEDIHAGAVHGRNRQGQFVLYCLPTIMAFDKAHMDLVDVLHRLERALLEEKESYSRNLLFSGDKADV